MLDHVFFTAIEAIRGALEESLLERQPIEEQLKADVLLGDLTWESSYSLPGEDVPPRVRADLLVEWPAWSQVAYRAWAAGDTDDDDDEPELLIDLSIRLQRLPGPPDLTSILALFPEVSPALGDEALERTGPAVEVVYGPDLEVVEAAVEVVYEGVYALDETELEDAAALGAHYRPLGAWLASTLVRLTDLPFDFLPPDPLAN